MLSARLAAAGIKRPPHEIVLCHGASQGIALAVRLFAQAGEAVAVEVPTYHNILGTLTALGVNPAPVASTPNGVDLADLERVLSRPDVKALYTIPTFHNPLGTTTSLAHRRALLEVAARCGKPVLEDGFEMDLRYAGRPVAPLGALDRHGLVVHLSSFSKSLFPGVRVGAIAASGRAIEGLVALKHSTDLSDALLLQAALAEFLESGGYDRHLTRIRRVMRSRRDALLAALERSMPDGTSWTEPEGGYQCWVELPFEVDTRDLLADAASGRCALLAGRRSSCRTHDLRAAMRLTVACADEEPRSSRGVARPRRSGGTRTARGGAGGRRGWRGCTSSQSDERQPVDEGRSERAGTRNEFAGFRPRSTGGTKMSKANGEKGNGAGRRGAEAFELKVGLAEMMKNGVIMDVTVRRAGEDRRGGGCLRRDGPRAGARRISGSDGGVARMSNVEMIEQIQKTVSIPVMAKVRIGHIVRRRGCSRRWGSTSSTRARCSHRPTTSTTS